MFEQGGKQAILNAQTCADTLAWASFETATRLAEFLEQCA
jgi:hypothetical protein